MRKNAWKKALLLALLCGLTAALLSGCGGVLPENDTFFTGEAYPDAEKYQPGAFSYSAAGIKAVEVYWRSGEVEIIESESAVLRAEESGGSLPQSAALHSLLEDGVLKIRFCASGAEIQVRSTDKRLRLEVPKGIELSIHTTSARLHAEGLEQKSVLIAAFSGSTTLGTVAAENVDLSSSSGRIEASGVSAQSLRCSASSGCIQLDAVAAKQIACTATSGDVKLSGVVSDALEISTSSGCVELAFIQAPSAVVRTSSGTVRAALPQGGAEVSFVSGSGSLRASRAYTRKGDLYVFGEGENGLAVQTSSGNLEIQ